MHSSLTPVLQTWLTFFQMTGESAATLVGLMFVIVTLAARQISDETLPIVRTFVTPTLMYFVAALLLSALLCIPTQTYRGLSAELWGFFVLEFGYFVRILLQMRRYVRVMPLKAIDQLRLSAFPGLACICVATTSVLLHWHDPAALNTLSIGLLLLICTGILNAWELVIMLAHRLPE